MTQDTSIQVEDYSIIFSKEIEPQEGLIIRTFKIYKDQKEIREIHQIHLKTWPDHQAPQNKHSVKYIIEQVDLKRGYGPVIVHCSAGNGRTGCFIAIYCIYQCFKLLKEINQELQQTIRPFFSIFNICRKLREQRQGMISSYDQYKFLYDYTGEMALEFFH